METILRINCTDEKGLVYKISELLFKNDFNITENDEFVDEDNGRFLCERLLKAIVIEQKLPTKF